ncbi:MAG: NAD(P)/FAD-dependent oxidoreductase [Vicinamibacterales bacterium]
MTAAEVVIVGGGVVGSSIGYHLRQDGFTGRIVIIERDPTYARSSSSLAMGGIRQQFGSVVNIHLAQYSIAFYKDFDRRMSVGGHTSRAWFRQRGYLFLVDAASAAAFERRHDILTERGAHVRRLSPGEIRAMLPDLVADDLVFGLMGTDDGYANPKEVLHGFRAGARAAGVEYVHDEVREVARTGGRITGVALASGTRIQSPVVVNAGGPFTARVAALAGLEQPVKPMRQHLFRCDLPRPWPYRWPMTVDPGGIHWRHDDPVEPGQPDRIILAKTKLDEPYGQNFDCDGSRWLANFYPDLVRRVPAFRDVRGVEGWAGLYEMTPDHNPMIGEHPALEGFFMANGFSGHGLMMAPATGKVVSELIRTGRAETVDVSALSIDRFARGELVWDEAMI